MSHYPMLFKQVQGWMHSQPMENKVFWSFWSKAVANAQLKFEGVKFFQMEFYLDYFIYLECLWIECDAWVYFGLLIENWRGTVCILFFDRPMSVELIDFAAK